MKKNLIILLMVLSVLLCSAVVIPANAYDSTDAIKNRMTELKTYFPNGKYWNAGKSQSQLISAAQSGNWSQSAFGVTSSGCRHSSSKYACSCHGYKCTSNHYAGGVQCYAFARFIGYLLWPEYGNPQNCDGWKKISGTSVTSVVLEPGDIICQGNQIHSAIVYSVSGTTVTVAEVWGSNGTGMGGKNHGKAVGCRIAWGYYNGKEKNKSMSTILNLVKKAGGYILKHPGSAPSVSLSIPATMNLSMGQRSGLTATGNYTTLTWSTSDSAVAIVTDDGLVTGIKPGNAVITATADGVTSRQCSVTVSGSASTEYDFGNETALLKSFSVALQGNTRGQCFCFYNSNEAATYTFFSSGSNDAYAVLYDSSWNEIARNDDGNGNRNFSLSCTLKKGERYYLFARSYDMAMDDQYDLYVRKDYSELYEGIITFADILEPSHNLYYSFTPAETATYTIYSMGSLDTRGYLYSNIANEPLASDDDSGENSNFSIEYDLEAGQTYYIKANLRSTLDTGNFTIIADKKSPPYVAVTGIGYFAMEPQPGEYSSAHYIIYPEGATNQSVWCDEVDNDICTISADGTIYAKKNGQSEICIHSAENPDISVLGLVYVHNPIRYSVNASVDASGTVVLHFSGLPNSADRISGFMLYSSNSSHFRMKSSLLPGYSGATDESCNEWGTGQYFVAFVNPRDNILTADQEVTFRLIPEDLENLWGTEQTYSFLFYPYYEYGSLSRTVESAKLEFKATVTFPQKPTGGICGNDAYWYYEDGRLTIYGSGTMDSYAKPTDQPWYMYCNSTSVIDIYEGISQVGEGAFEGFSSLYHIYLPEGLTSIGARAFTDCSNESNICVQVEIPKSTKTINSEAMDNGSVTIVCWENSYAHSFAKSHGFSYSFLDTPLNNPDFILPSSTVAIETEAFCQIAAKRILLPESVKTVGSKAFSQCGNLQGIYIPASCTSIASDAFAGSNAEMLIYGSEGSVAESFASQNGYPFICID